MTHQFTTVDYHADAVYIDLIAPDSQSPVRETVEVAPGINFDWNTDGLLQGIEFLSVDIYRRSASALAKEYMVVRIAK